ncbi:MAG: hypothetical protein V3S30_02540 [Thermoanaerobaculia bacterium]
MQSRLQKYSSAQMRRGNDRLLSRLAAADSILLPTIVLGELDASILAV